MRSQIRGPVQFGQRSLKGYRTDSRLHLFQEDEGCEALHREHQLPFIPGKSDEQKLQKSTWWPTLLHIAHNELVRGPDRHSCRFSRYVFIMRVTLGPSSRKRSAPISSTVARRPATAMPA